MGDLGLTPEEQMEAAHETATEFMVENRHLRAEVSKLREALGWEKCEHSSLKAEIERLWAMLAEALPLIETDLDDNDLVGRIRAALEEVRRG